MMAYIDGTTGGMMVQIILAGIVGGFVAIKLLARNFVASIIGRFRGNKEGATSAKAEEADRAG